MHRATAAGVAGTGWPDARHASAIRPACRPAAGTPGRPGRRPRRRPARAAASAQQRGQVGDAPGPHALLQQPEAHDVAQVADRAVDAALVGEVGLPGRLGEHRRGRARPRPATRCRRRCRRSARRRPAPRRRPRRCRASRPPPRPACSGSRSGSTGPITVPGAPQRREQMPAAGPSSASSGRPSSRVRTSSSWVVDALVTSAPTSPVSQYASRSGISSRCRAASNCGVPAAATSW